MRHEGFSLHHLRGSKYKANSNCNFTGLPTLHGSDVRLSHMNVFDKILLITKITFIDVVDDVSHSLLSSDHSTYEAELDPINKVRQVMTIILPSIKSRELIVALISLSDPQHNNAVRSSGTTKLILCVQRCPAAYYQLQTLCQKPRAVTFMVIIKYLAVLQPNYCPA